MDNERDEEDEIESILQYAENEKDIFNLSDSLGSLLNEDEEEEDNVELLYSSGEDDLLGVKSPASSLGLEGADLLEDPPTTPTSSNSNGNNNHSVDLIIHSPTVEPVPAQTTSSTKPKKSQDSVRDFDFPPSKIIKLTDTGRYNHVKPLRIDAKPKKESSSYGKTQAYVSPWRKTTVAHHCLLPDPDSSSKVNEKVAMTSKPAAKTIKSRLQLSSKIANLKFKPRTEFRKQSTTTPTTSITGQPSATKDATSSSIFNKRAFNFSARSSFGVAMSQLKSSRSLASDNAFHLTHLQSAKPVAMAPSTVATATDKFSLPHLK